MCVCVCHVLFSVNLCLPNLFMAVSENVGVLTSVV